MSKQKSQILLLKIDEDLVIGEILSETEDEYYLAYPLNINVQYSMTVDGVSSQISVTKHFPFAAKNIVSFNKSRISSYSLPNSHIRSYYCNFVMEHSKQLDTFMNGMLSRSNKKIEVSGESIH